MGEREKRIIEDNRVVLERARVAQSSVQGSTEFRIAQYLLSCSNSLLVIATVLNELCALEMEDISN